MKKKQKEYDRLKNTINNQICSKIPSFVQKSYAHFDRPFTLVRYITKVNSNTKSTYKISPDAQKKIKQHIESLRNYLSSPDKIATHAFYPFIAFDIKERRANIINKIKYYEKKSKELSGPELESCNKILKNLKEKGIIKKRPIRYAAHIDGYIYSYYAKLLYEKYEQKLKELNLGPEILAYRTLPKIYIKDSEISPNNCTMAREIFEHIKKRKNNCYALAFDIHSFYDYIDHKKLYQEWTKVLNTDKLPADHLNIYRSLTKYCFIDLKEICYYINKNKCTSDACSKCNKKIYKQIPKILFYNAKQFRTFKKWYKETYKNTEHKKFHKNPGLNDKFPYGIPQGTSMSALLSNIYMIPFDVNMKNLAEEVNGIYRRYCDDIMFICPHDETIKKYVIEKIQEYILERGNSLSIHPIEAWDDYSKSQCYDFTNIKKIMANPLQYLGFYFNGEQVRIREASLARYLRKSKRAVSAMKLNAKKKLENMHKKGIVLQDKHKKLYRRLLYERYTYLGKRNFISYVLRTFDKVFDTAVLKHQIHNHKKRLDNLIKQADSELLATYNELVSKK